MKILLDLNEWQHLDLLKSWASVSRTLNAAKQLISNFEDKLRDDSGDEALIEQCGHTQGELIDIEPMLDSLHQLTRNRVWAMEADDKKFDTADIIIERSSDLMLAYILQKYIELSQTDKPKEQPTTDRIIKELIIRVTKSKKEHGHI